MKGSAKIEIPNFYTYSKNRAEKNGGGISTSIANKESSKTLKIKEGIDDKEYIITRHDQFTNPINLINIYGMNECRQSREKIVDFWDTIVRANCCGGSKYSCWFIESRK